MASHHHFELIFQSPYVSFGFFMRHEMNPQLDDLPYNPQKVASE